MVFTGVPKSDLLAPGAGPHRVWQRGLCSKVLFSAVLVSEEMEPCHFSKWPSLEMPFLNPDAKGPSPNSWKVRPSSEAPPQLGGSLSVVAQAPDVTRFGDNMFPVFSVPPWARNPSMALVVRAYWGAAERLGPRCGGARAQRWWVGSARPCLTLRDWDGIQEMSQRLLLCFVGLSLQLLSCWRLKVG